MAKKNRNKRKNQNKTDELKLEEGQILKSLAGNLEEALGEDYGELDEVMGEDTGDTSSEPHHKGKKGFLIIGIVVILFAIIGFLSTVGFFVKMGQDIADETELKNEFALFLYPVVTADIPAFDVVENLPQSTIITTALWRIILEGDKSNYEIVNGYYMTVPSADVESAARQIFGSGYTIEHQTVGDVELLFEYNEETKSYLVPKNPRFTSYSPVIKEISCVGELYTIVVDYMPPTAMNVAGLDIQSEPEKTVTYTVSRSKDKKTINSMEYSSSGDQQYIY